MAVRDSTQYTNVEVNANVADPRDKGGRIVPIPFTHTVVSGELGGASAGVSDEVRLCVLPANCEVIGFEMDWGALSASAAVGLTMDVGDSGDINRYGVALDGDEASSTGVLAAAGMRFRPTTDTIVLLGWGVANPIVGIVVKGRFLIVPGT